MEEKNSKNILVLYHGDCTDGFGAAYAAWKKFGDTAEYIPQHRDKVPEVSLFKDKEVYVVDYSYSQEEMRLFQSVANKFVVIDHHITAQKSIELLDEYVFALDHSGAYLAWKYFHSDTKVPRLIEYISDADIWAHSLPHWDYVESYLYKEAVDKFTFSYFEALHRELESEEGFENVLRIGKILCDAHRARVTLYADQAEKVLFEGYEIYAINAPREVRSEVGNVLAEKTGTFSLIFTYEKGLWKCSLRSVKQFDVTILAEKYGGGGHKNAAAFIVPTTFPLSFIQSIKEG